MASQLRFAFSTLSLLALGRWVSLGAAANNARTLSNTKIAGYEPGSDVESHNRLDLDQKEMEMHLAQTPPEYVKASLIYNKGANSGARARLTVPALGASVEKGAVVTQGDTVARGFVKSPAAAGATEVDVTYASVCKEGGTSTPDTSGCFTVNGGTVTVGGDDIGLPTVVSNTYRTLAGFSTAAYSKMNGQKYYDQYHAYNNIKDYGHQYVTSALEGTGQCAGLDDKARVELAKKGSVYMNVWMYVIREMEDAVTDCTAGCINCNDDPVHAWDEAVAFYTGSLEGPEGSGAGKMLHALADKRCQNFHTCGADGGSSSGTSAINLQILTLFKQGQHKLLTGMCSDVAPIVQDIVGFMSVPLIQGALRYAYKVDKLQGGSKEKAEGAVFADAVLPNVHFCDAAKAQLIKDNLGRGASNPMAAGFAAVKSAFESTYTCLGITCEDVGGLILSGTDYYEGAQPCGAYNKIGGYTPKSNVVSHSRLDLDQQEMEAHLAKTPPDFVKASLIYNKGANSGARARLAVSALGARGEKGAAVTQGHHLATGNLKSAATTNSTLVDVTYTSTCKEGGTSFPQTSGCFTASGGVVTVGSTVIGAPTQVSNTYRTLAGFSTGAFSKMNGQQYYDIYRAYTTKKDYGHQYVTSALEGTGQCAGLDDKARVELAKKASVYMNVWMYVIREMEDAVADCKAGCAYCNDDPVHAWDEAVAFYTGSLEGQDGTGPGKMLHALAEKRCANFNTCGPNGGSSSGPAFVNLRILALFNEGQTKLLNGMCSEVRPILQGVVELMSVPLIQGALRYAYKIDKLGQDGPKERAEGSIFVDAILPRIRACDAAKAKLIADNMGIGATTPMASGYSAVKNGFESTYTCLGIACDDVGGILKEGAVYYEGAEPCSGKPGDVKTPVVVVTEKTLVVRTVQESDGDSDNDLPMLFIILCIAVGIFLIIVVVAVVIVWRMRLKNQPAALGEHATVAGVPVGRPIEETADAAKA